MLIFKKYDDVNFKFIKQIKVSLSLLDIYIIKELIKSFFFSFIIFLTLGITLGAGYDLIYEMIDSGLSIITALKILALKIPELIVYILPISLLLSCILTYNHFHNSNELIAFQTIGISPIRLIYPALITGFLIFLITFPLYNFVVPETNYYSRIIALKEIKKDNYSLFKNQSVFKEYQTVINKDGNKKEKLTKIFYVKKNQSNTLKDIILIDMSRKEFKQVTIAEYATINLWTNTWDFTNGAIYIFNQQDDNNSVIKFKHKSIYLPLSNQLLNIKNRKNDELNLYQLNKILSQHINNYDHKKILELKTRLYKNFSVPLISIFFSFLGVILGIKLNQLGKSFGFALCVVIVFFYYLISFISESMAKLEVLLPLLGIWLPNILVFLGSILLLICSKNNTWNQK